MAPEVLDLIARLVQVLVWPAVVLTLIILARKEIRTVLLSLRRVKYREFEADFSRRVEELEERAERVAPEPKPVPAQPSQSDVLRGLMELSPRLAVVEAFTLVEDAVRRAAIRHGVPEDMVTGVRNRVLELEKMNLVNAELKRLFHDLRETRNELSHVGDAEISPRAAKGYVNAARLVALRFDIL